MSVLLAYGTSKEAVIMADSRATYYDEYGNIVGFKEDEQKIYKITDRFIIGAAGNANGSNIIEKIDVYDSKSSFSTLKYFTYDELLAFFLKRIKIFGIDKISYSAYITVGIDATNKIRMDTFNNITCKFDSACPQNNDLLSTIYLSSNVSPDYKVLFTCGLGRATDKEKYCENAIKEISKNDNTVNDIIQKYKISL